MNTEWQGNIHLNDDTLGFGLAVLFSLFFSTLLAQICKFIDEISWPSLSKTNDEHVFQRAAYDCFLMFVREQFQGNWQFVELLTGHSLFQKDVK